MHKRGEQPPPPPIKFQRFILERIVLTWNKLLPENVDVTSSDSHSVKISDIRPCVFEDTTPSLGSPNLCWWGSATTSDLFGRSVKINLFCNLSADWWHLSHASSRPSMTSDWVWSCHIAVYIFTLLHIITLINWVNTHFWPNHNGVQMRMEPFGAAANS